MSKKVSLFVSAIALLYKMLLKWLIHGNILIAQSLHKIHLIKLEFLSSVIFL